MIKDTLLDAILPQVVFDGWSDTAFKAAVAGTDVPLDDAQLACPRGALDLAVHMHRRGDDAMVQALRAKDMSALRFRDKVAEALWLRLEAIPDKEALRRASALFALPQHAGEGARLMWQTTDTIWRALGDGSQDYNWYTKRATLYAVWSTVVLYWLGDTSEDHAATRAFIDRRIDNVMQIEKAKASVRKHALLGPLTRPLEQALSHIRAPLHTPDTTAFHSDQS